MRKFSFIFIAFLFAYGCVTSMGADDYSENYYSQLGRVAVSDPDQLEECEIGSCYCFVCESGITIESLAFSNNLAGGRCYWNRNCTQETTSSILGGEGNEQLMIRQFMIGQGPSISDFADAQPYCHHGLGMAVQWLQAQNDSPDDLPDAERAICLLSVDIMPVYVMYSAGQEISSEWAGNVAHVLATEGDDVTLGTLTEGPVGPVVIITEMNFEASQADDVADQVRRINDECNPNRRTTQDADEEGGEINCFVAVAPRFNDYAAMDAIMSVPGLADEIDFIAYGIDYRYAHGCDPDDIIVTQAINFSRHALYDYGKPTIIPYVLFDATGNDSDNSCGWDENKMVEAYSAFWPDSILALQQRGVIGVAPYSMFSTQYGVSNPLNCTDCDLGKNENRLTAWFAGCQDYARVARGSQTHRGEGTPIIFPNESAGYCDYNQNLAFMFRQVSYASVGGGGDLLNPVQAELDEPDEPLYRCSSCITQNLTATQPPFDFTHATTWTMEPMAEEYCTGIPEIEAWADRRNIDPILVRAFIYTESGFDPCAAPMVCAADYNAPGCFARVTSGASECYDKPAYNEMYDPAGTCNDQLPIAPDADTSSPDWRWCAVGLMQTVTPPYTFWPDEQLPEGADNPHYDIFDASGFDTPGMRNQRIPAAEDCAIADGQFNPFNASHALCEGTANIAENLRDARTWINEHRYQLNWAEDEYEKDNVFAAYIAANMYAGFWYASATNPICSASMTNGNCWARNFADSWEIDEDYCQDNQDEDGNYPPECTDEGLPDEDQCYGYTDFVLYVNDCEIEHLPRQADPGANKLAVYYRMKNTCEVSWCPPTKRLIQLAHEDNWQSMLPSSGNPYILDEEEETEEEDD